jgi:hypothetical protein
MLRETGELLVISAVAAAVIVVGMLRGEGGKGDARRCFGVPADDQ